MLGASVSGRSPCSDAVVQTAAYESALRAKLEDSAGTLLSTADVPHDVLVRKATQQTAFFTDKGTSEMPALRIRAVEMA